MELVMVTLLMERGGKRKRRRVRRDQEARRYARRDSRRCRRGRLGPVGGLSVLFVLGVALFEYGNLFRPEEADQSGAPEESEPPQLQPNSSLARGPDQSP